MLNPSFKNPSQILIMDFWMAKTEPYFHNFLAYLFSFNLKKKKWIYLKYLLRLLLIHILLFWIHGLYYRLTNNTKKNYKFNTIKHELVWTLVQMTFMLTTLDLSLLFGLETMWVLKQCWTIVNPWSFQKN
jgi:hypothetical protein